MSRPKKGDQGGMAEWTIATVLKTVGRKPRGFESLSLREKGMGAFFISCAWQQGYLSSWTLTLGRSLRGEAGHVPHLGESFLDGR
jgi:hypothetical protein